MFSRDQIKRLFDISKNQIVDETDFYIICLLEHEGETKIAKIVDHLKENGVELSPAAVSLRIRRLKEKGILIGMVPLSRLNKLGFSRDLLLLIQTEPGRDLDKIIDQIIPITGVKRMYQIFGEYDLLVELCCLGDEGLEKSLAAINCVPGLSRISKSPIRHRIKEHYQLIKEESLGEEDKSA
ncbi:MAG: Lrp/AsnC family transcriptional regulator [Candidatus Hodarchaeales archaeon]|jgi:DNA-binding Lrp family transcriptional regulator